MERRFRWPNNWSPCQGKRTGIRMQKPWNIPTRREALIRLAELYEDMSRYAEAEPLYQEALKIRQKVLGPEHPDTATSLNNLALLYVRMGDYGKASQEAGISEAVVADYGSLPEGR